MKYEEVEDCILRSFPDFLIDETVEGLQYCVAGSFAYYLLEAYKNASVDTLILAGKFIEELYASEEEQIRNLATVGYLEAIQNVWGNHSVDPEKMVKYLGDTSRKWWEKLNRLWQGDLHAWAEEV